MSREPFETMPDVMNAKQLAEALQISKAGAYNLLNSPDFPTLRIGGRKLVMKNQTIYMGMIELDTLIAKFIKRFEIKSSK